MKKIYLIIFASLFCLTISAQYPANRTAKTIVADVLAQMPSKKTDGYNTMMKDLASVGEDGVLQLVKMFDEQKDKNTAAIEYALSGLSNYVSANGLEDSRLVISNAFIKSLDQVSDREVKAFVIRQLERIAKDEAIEKLSSFLADSLLSGPASRALASIKTEGADNALLNALTSSTDEKVQKDILEAIAMTQNPNAEEAVKSFLGKGSVDMQKVALYALSRCGSKASLKDLGSAAQKANYTMEMTGATEAYIALIKRVLLQGNIKDAEKAAKDLMKKAEKASQTHAREAALEIQMAAKSGDVLKLVQNALKDKNKDYRFAALNFASNYVNNDLYAGIVKIYQKAKPEVQTDILTWFNQESDDSGKLTLIQGLDAKMFSESLYSDNLDLRTAAGRLLARIGGDESVSILANLLTSSDTGTITMAEDLLNRTSGKIAPAVVAAIPSATDAGKIAALKILANRKSTENVDLVIEQANNGSAEVKKVAYSALKDVVSKAELPTLYSLLENAQSENVAVVQQAIKAALKGSDSKAQFAMITQQISKAPVDKQSLYYSILASTKAPEALETITALFGQTTGKMRDDAFQALLEWDGNEIAGVLYQLCKDPSFSAYLDRALNRYIQLASSSKLTGENRRLLLTNAMELAKTDQQKNNILKQLGQTGSYLGMLLAGEYLDQTAVQQAAAGAVMDIALKNKEYTGSKVKELLNKVIEVLDNPDASYQKEAIRKHLNEMPEEEGFVSIFNGKDLTGWKGLVENPIARSKMKPAELAKKQMAANEVAVKHWSAKDGVLTFDGTGSDNLCTDKQYGDFEMYIDWNLDPAGPEADAGVYLRGTPQVQIWDTSRVNVGAQVGSGGLYNNTKNESKPSKVADNQLGEWNTFYIKMVGDRVTVKLNGELVVNNVIMENYWDRSLPIFVKEQIELQAHGSKVYYRNIYVKELKSPEPFQLSAEEKKEGYKVLFDGTNMHHWTGNTVDYAIEDGCISLDPKGGHGGNLYSKDEYGNFVLRFEFQLTPGANNGLGIRTPLKGDAAYVGMELQILDNDAPVYEKLAVYQYHGSVYGIIPAKRGYLKPVGEWNYQEVVANGDNIKVTLNGTVILDGNIREATKDGTADKQKHPGLFNEKGHIGFLGHGSPVKFKNIRIKELK